MPLLDKTTFTARLDVELGRTRRLGGFVSAALFARVVGAKDVGRTSSWTGRGAHVLAASIRVYDLLGAWDPLGLAVALPGTSPSQAMLGAQRLLRALRDDPLVGLGVAGGIASAYGDVDGGASALIGAAEAALARAAPGEVAFSEAQHGRPRVLVVDDDPSFARSLAETIAEDDWEADSCSEPEDALTRVREVGYHGIFVDLVLPRVTGVDILRESLQHYPRRPAILMSGQDADHDAVLDALALGPVMFIRKPISAADLRAALRMFRVLVPGSDGR